CGSSHVFGRDVVERAPLVVRAPPAPVLHGLEHGLELGEGDGGLSSHRIAPGSGASISPGSGRPIDNAPSTTIRCPDRYEASSKRSARSPRGCLRSPWPDQPPAPGTRNPSGSH